MTFYWDSLTWVGESTGNGGSDNNGGSEVSPYATPWDGFGGALANNDTSTFSVPASAEAWAGFANLNADIYPFSFAEGGTISFTGAVPSGGDVNVDFRFERLPHPDVDPAFNTGAVTVSGATETTYTVTVAAQDAANTFSSFLFYLAELNVEVVVKDVKVLMAQQSNDSDR